MRGPFRLLAALRTDVPVLLAGGGAVGTRKARTLGDAGAEVHLVSPEATEELADRADRGEIRWERRRVAAEDFRTHRFAVLALDEATTREVLPLAEGSGCLLCCCALPREGDFALAAQWEHHGFALGVASGGEDPAGAGAMKRRLQRLLEGQNGPAGETHAAPGRDDTKERTP
ncbi:precorrin-2 dehydrogenase/sirohydrochlorin ferrochelatase family protein [Aminomonas paucivorans]|uniref:precorrin-2 dehydrogenase/sirohydrochlorin ferrochelatase family protein n=1 Tax=Aminomonas paucivorans TaxID=81412 RepID=UPI0033310ABF